MSGGDVGESLGVVLGGGEISGGGDVTGGADVSGGGDVLGGGLVSGGGDVLGGGLVGGGGGGGGVVGVVGGAGGVGAWVVGRSSVEEVGVADVAKVFDAVGDVRGVPVSAGPMNGILICSRFGSFVGVDDVAAAVDDAAGCDELTGVPLLRAGDAAPATVSDGIGAGVGSLKSNRGRAPPV